MTEHDAQPDLFPDDSLTVVLDGRGHGREIAAGDFAKEQLPEGDPGFAWQHLRRDHPGTPGLLAAARLDSFVIDALMADETRPRCTVHEDGVILNLRGINAHPQAEPGDMVSLRFWLERKRIVSTSSHPIEALSDLIGAIRRGVAPKSPGELVSRLALRLADRAEPSVADLNERIDDIEERLVDAGDLVLRSDLAEVRRSAILLRRYMAPQRDALSTLEIEDLDWLSVTDRAHVREATERIVRLAEDLDSIRDRAQIVHDQLIDQRAESLNRRMLLLTLVAAIFLPLGLITGLLGINVGGIPGAQFPGAFAIVCLLLAVVGIAVVAVFRYLGMFR